MAQINFYVPDDLELKIKNAAKENGLSLSVFLADIVRKQMGGSKEWPEGFFTNVIGKSQGDFPEMEDLPPQGRDWKV